LRICDIYIDGFGIYHNQAVNDIPDGLILFTGKNEGGKTTLMEFIRAILFGFPSFKNRNDYHPLRGGTYGGRVRLVMNDGRIITVERFGKKAIIKYEDRSSEQAEPSERLFNIDRRTFENIFAIGLGDLQGLGILSDEGIKGRIFAASAGINEKLFSNMMDNVEKELGNLLKSGRATNPLINQIMRRLAEIGSEIKELRKGSEDYAEFQKRLAELNDQIEKDQKKISDMNKRLDRIKQIEQARNIWIELIETEKMLDELNFASRFPPKGLERFEKLKEDINNAQLERNDLENKARQLEAQLQNIVIAEGIIENRKSIESLMNERNMLISALNDLPKVDRERQQKENEFKKQLKDLGADWDSERLAEVDTSIQTRHRVQDFARNIEFAEQKDRQAKTNLQNRQNDEKNAKALLDEAQKALNSFDKPTITEKDEIRKQREVIQQIRSSFYQIDNLNMQLNAKHGSIERENNYLRSLKDQELLQIPSWAWIIIILIGVTLIGLSIAIRSYISGVLIFLFVIASMFGLRALKNHQIKSKKKINDQIESHENIIKQILEEIKDIESKIKEKKAEINESAHSIGLESLNDISEIDKFERNLDKIDETLRNWDMLKGKRDDAERNYQIAVKNLKEATQLAESADKELQTIKEEWRQWITERGFDANIRPEGFETVLQMVEKARNTENSIQETISRVKQMNDYIAKTRKEITDILIACNMNPKSSEVGVSEIDALNVALKTALDNQRKQAELNEKLDDTRREIKKLSARIANWQNELNELMKKAQAKNEDDFRYIGESYNNWLKCKDKYEINRRNLINLAGNEEAVKSLELELKETDSFSLSSEKEELERNIEDTNKQVQKSLQEKGELNEKIKNILQDEKLSNLLFEQKVKEEQLSVTVKRWATLVVLQSLIKQSMEKYERERQPKVLQEASNYIKIITDRNYRLMKPIGEYSVKIENADTMERKDEIGWSGGLADQVYLSVRFGLAHAFSETSEPLPIILDDVFVRFDQDRQLGTAKVILNVAKSHQIFIFSCHPLTREIIENAIIEIGLNDSVPLTHYIIDDGTIMKV